MPAAVGFRGSARRAAFVVDLDALLAHLAAHGLLVGDGVLVEAHALLGNRDGLGDGDLLVESDLVLLVGDRGAVGRAAGVRLGDRLALDADLLALYRHGLLDLVGHDVLLEPHATALPRGLTYPQLLLGAGHRVVGLGAADVPPDRVAVGRVAVTRARLAVAHAVVLVELPLLRLRQLLIGIDLRRVLDLVLLVLHAQRVVLRARAAQRHERRLAAEQPGLDERPLGLARLLVQVDLLNRADLVATGVDHIGAAQLGDALRRHSHLPPPPVGYVRSEAYPSRAREDSSGLEWRTLARSDPATDRIRKSEKHGNEIGTPGGPMSTASTTSS